MWRKNKKKIYDQKRNISKETENKQTKKIKNILELKSMITEIKNLLGAFKCRFE